MRDFTFYKDTLHLLCSRPWKSSFYIKATNDFVQVEEITETRASIIKIKVGNSYLVSLNYNFKGTKSFFYEKNKNIILTGNPYHNKWLKESNTLFEAWRIEYNLGTSNSYYSIDNVLFSFNDPKYHHEFENEIYSIWQYANNIYLSQPNYILEQNLSSKRSTQLFKGKRPCSITAD